MGWGGEGGPSSAAPYIHCFACPSINDSPFYDGFEAATTTSNPIQQTKKLSRKARHLQTPSSNSADTVGNNQNRVLGANIL